MRRLSIKTYLTQVREKAKISRAQIYRHYEVVRHRFEEIKEGRGWYVGY